MNTHRQTAIAWLTTARRHGLTVWRRLCQRRALFALATLCTALALTLPMVSLLVVKSVGAQIADWRDSYYFTAYLDPSLDDDQGREIAEQWLAQDDVRNITLITRAQAAADFAAATGAGDLITALGENPLPVVIQVWPVQTLADTAEVQALVERLSGTNGVVEIDSDLVWFERANAVHTTLQRSSWLISALLAVIAVALVASHIRQQLAALSDEIALSKLVGATDSTLRMPFLLSGALIGLLAGLLAVGLSWATLNALDEPVAALAASYQSDFELQPASWAAMTPFLIAAVVIGVVGAGLAIEMRLRRIQPV